jgi:hypothetical protein
MIPETLAMILRSLSALAGLTDVFGKDAARLQPVLNVVAGFAELPGGNESRSGGAPRAGQNLGGGESRPDRCRARRVQGFPRCPRRATARRSSGRRQHRGPLICRAAERVPKNWHAIGWLVLLIILAVFSVSANAQAASPTLTFTAQTTTGNGSVVPALTWATSPAAQSCTASGDPAWTGTKAAAGTQTLAAITSSKTYQLVCTWPGDTTATISWTDPDHEHGRFGAREVHQPDRHGDVPASFLVVRGSDPTSVGMDSKTVDDRNATSYAWTGLTVGTHWFSA